MPVLLLQLLPFKLFLVLLRSHLVLMHLFFEHLFDLLIFLPLKLNCLKLILFFFSLLLFLEELLPLQLINILNAIGSDLLNKLDSIIHFLKNLSRP